MVQQNTPNPQQNQDPYSLLVELNNRLRILEERYSTNRERMFVMNQNMIDHYKRTNSELSAINEDIKELKGDIFTVKETVKHLVQELENFARKDQLKVLEKYINMWNPFNFVTEEEVLKLIEKKRQKNVKPKR
jgi:predicted transcriptional regulator